MLICLYFHIHWEESVFVINKHKEILRQLRSSIIPSNWKSSHDEFINIQKKIVYVLSRQLGVCFSLKFSSLNRKEQVSKEEENVQRKLRDHVEVFDKLIRVACGAAQSGYGNTNENQLHCCLHLLWNTFHSSKVTLLACLPIYVLCLIVNSRHVLKALTWVTWRPALVCVRWGYVVPKIDKPPGDGWKLVRMRWNRLRYWLCLVRRHW